ncbi:MAG: hypothetical protein K0R98_1042 [Rickettsiaceae bacterium]|jgi:hypothetical protein|nr:hypothetical protein [Rickettsiaceae bacterium]
MKQGKQPINREQKITELPAISNHLIDSVQSECIIKQRSVFLIDDLSELGWTDAEKRQLRNDLPGVNFVESKRNYLSKATPQKLEKDELPKQPKPWKERCSKSCRDSSCVIL